jgi:hypothetical protein
MTTTTTTKRRRRQNDDDVDEGTFLYIARAVTVRNGKISFGDSDANQALSFREHGNPVALLLVPSRVT